MCGLIGGGGGGGGTKGYVQIIGGLTPPSPGSPLPTPMHYLGVCSVLIYCFGKTAATPTFSDTDITDRTHLVRIS